MSEIKLKGVWLWVWVPWHAAWLFGLVWVPFFWPGVTSWYYRVLYTAFLFAEAIGTWKQEQAKERGTGWEVARTLSQYRQWIGQQKKYLKVLAAGTAAIDASLMWYITKDIHPAVGAITAVAIWLWLAPHFGWRGRVG